MTTEAHGALDRVAIELGRHREREGIAVVVNCVTELHGRTLDGAGERDVACFALDGSGQLLAVLLEDDLELTRTARGVQGRVPFPSNRLRRGDVGECKQTDKKQQDDRLHRSTPVRADGQTAES